jgi:hypothetical protein
MRIVLPCATIAAITSAWGLLVSADGGAAASKELDAVDGGDDDDDIATSRSRAPRSMRDAAEDGEECDHHHLEQGGIGTKADVGVLRCGPGRTCAADVTSSVGGRCVTSSSSSSSVFPIERPDAPRMAAFPSRGLHVMTERGEHALHRLQNSTEYGEFVCPTNCPQDVCDCFLQDDAAMCAPAVHSACITGLFSECVPDYYPQNYTEIYCDLAACLADGPEGCVSEYSKYLCLATYALEEDVNKCCCYVQAMSQISENAAVSLAACLVDGPVGCTSEYYKDYCRATYALEEDVDKCCCYLQMMYQIYGKTTVSAAPTPTPSDPPKVSPAPMITSASNSSSVLTTVPSVAPTSSPRGAPMVEPSDSPVVMPAPIIIPAEVDAVVPGSVATPPPTTASSGGRTAAHRPIAMAAFAASLIFSAGGAFWIFV